MKPIYVYTLKPTLEYDLVLLNFVKKIFKTIIGANERNFIYTFVNIYEENLL
jgi:hypothetical protein